MLDTARRRTTVRSRTGKVCWVLLPLLFGGACSTFVYHRLAPDKPYLAGIYEWEVPHETRGFLVVRSPADSTGRDTLQAETGYLIECHVLDSAGPLVCGSCTFRPSRYGLTGECERCFATLVPRQESRRNVDADPMRQYVYSGYEACDTVRMGVWKRTGNVERE